MKLLFALVVVSALTLKVEGVDVAFGQTCVAADDTCTAASTSCISDGCGATKCLCSAGYEDNGSSVCKLLGGQTCSEDTKANCLSGKCSDERCEGTVADGSACTKNSDCVNLNCKMDDGTEKCTAGAPAGVMASLTLMLVALVTTRFL